MAIYHLSVQIISRKGKNGNQRSVVAAASYRSGQKLFDERYQKVRDYKKKVSPIAKIFVPDNAPEWAKDREKLWNEVEKVEKQYNSQLAREINVALPVELSHEEQEKLTFDFCQRAFVNEGMVADISIHRENKDNPYFIVLLTTRPFNKGGTWGAKVKRSYNTEKGESRSVRQTNWSDRDTLRKWRKQWEVMTNDYLEKNGIDERISCKSNEDLGKEVKPSIHEGYGRNINKRGKKSDRVKLNETIKDYNETVNELNKLNQKKQKKKQ